MSTVFSSSVRAFLYSPLRAKLSALDSSSSTPSQRAGKALMHPAHSPQRSCRWREERGRDFAVRAGNLPFKVSAWIEKPDVSNLLERVLGSCSFRGVEVSGVVVVDRPGSYGLALYHDKGTAGRRRAGWRVSTRQASTAPAPPGGSSVCASAGPRPLQEGLVAPERGRSQPQCERCGERCRVQDSLPA